MKFVVVLLTIVVVVSVSGLPAKKEENEKKGVRSNFQKPCIKSCDLDYKPICAGDGKEKPKSFGSVCVLDNYNCEHETALKKVSDGECPGGGGVRLS